MEDATLIVCPDARERSEYTRWLRDDGRAVVEAKSGSDAIAHHRRSFFPVTIAELASPQLDGVKLIQAVRHAAPGAEFLMLSRRDAVDAAVAAMKAGAADLLLKPIQRDALIESVRKMCGAVRALQELQQREEQLRQQYDFSEIIARAPQMLHVLAIAGRVAPRETTVLISGESGTGKELLARAIHRNSTRAAGPLVSINCAAIPEALLESELFGYRKGAFTGADSDKRGLLATADAGTVFLDEVAELPLSTQAKLLRFLQEGTYFPLGSLWPSTADVRLISATNADLVERVEAGTFRRDLYYRLSVFPLHIPPLRERADDIVPLAHHFLRDIESETGKKSPGLSREVVHYLTARSWRGNVRELQSAIVRAVIMSEGSLLTSADFRRLDRECAPGRPTQHQLIQLPEDGIDLPQLNRSLVVQALERTRHNVSSAARLLGLNRPTLRYRMKKYGIRGR
ncbi:MAG TPA: sigma-54 dependent transcriptional regulator [Candidatus Binatia bacterium]|nr:sigma-54 dependent transcriptional regulator [Candidatus Binatia bacterium]